MSANTANGCMQASLMLRRRIHRYRAVGVGEDQALLAVCGLLDALSHGFAQDPGAVSGAVERATRRLVDQLNRGDLAAQPPNGRHLATGDAAHPAIISAIPLTITPVAEIGDLSTDPPAATPCVLYRGRAERDQPLYPLLGRRARPAWAWLESAKTPGASSGDLAHIS